MKRTQLNFTKIVEIKNCEKFKLIKMLKFEDDN